MALVVIIAVVLVLVTPDPSDDVDAIVHAGKVIHLSVSQPLARVSLALSEHATQRFSVLEYLSAKLELSSSVPVAVRPCTSLPVLSLPIVTR